MAKKSSEKAGFVRRTDNITVSYSDMAVGEVSLTNLDRSRSHRSCSIPQYKRLSSEKIRSSHVHHDTSWCFKIEPLTSSSKWVHTTVGVHITNCYLQF